MNNKERMALILALAGGAVAGALIATSRGNRRYVQELPAPHPVLALPPANAVDRVDEHHALVPVFEPTYVEEAQHVQRPHITYEMVPWEPPRAASPAPWAFTVIGFGILFFAAIAVTLPRITSMAAPQSVLAGSTAIVEYHATGSGALSYEVESQGYRRSGQLQGHDGTILMPIAMQLANHNLVVTVRMNGALGNVERRATISILASPKPVVRSVDAEFPRIDALRLSAPAVGGGSTITANYKTNAPAGNVRLVDAGGAVWQSVPIVKSGIAQFTVPVVHKDTPFIVVVHAERKMHAIEASAAFVARGVSSGKAAAKQTNQLSKVPVFEVPPSARSGGVLPIAIPAGLKNAVVTMNNSAGVEMSRASVVSGSSITLDVPNVRTPEPFFVTLTYQVGNEKETLIRHVTVLPHSSLLP